MIGFEKRSPIAYPFFCGIEMTKKGGLNRRMIQYILGFAMNLFK